MSKCVALAALLLSLAAHAGPIEVMTCIAGLNNRGFITRLDITADAIVDGAMVNGKMDFTFGNQSTMPATQATIADPTLYETSIPDPDGGAETPAYLFFNPASKAGDHELALYLRKNDTDLGRPDSLTDGAILYSGRGTPSDDVDGDQMLCTVKGGASMLTPQPAGQ